MRPASILPLVKGMTRDYSVDSLPDGFVWDMKDFIPQHTDVLNGIAWDPATKRLWITGKFWPKVFEIKLVKR